MFSSLPGGVSTRGRPRSKWWSVFGYVLRREDLRIKEKFVGIRKNGRRPSSRRTFTWDFRSTKKKKKYENMVNM
jgi:hypothetical protein